MVYRRIKVDIAKTNMKNVRIVDITDAEFARLVKFIEWVAKKEKKRKKKTNHWVEFILNADRGFTWTDEIREGIEDPVEMSEEMRAAMEKVYIG